MGGWIYRGKIVARRGGARWREGKTVGLVGRSMPSGQSGATCLHEHGRGRGGERGDEVCVQRLYVRAGYVYRYLFEIQKPRPSGFPFLYYQL